METEVIFDPVTLKQLSILRLSMEAANTNKPHTLLVSLSTELCKLKRGERRRVCSYILTNGLPPYRLKIFHPTQDLWVGKTVGAEGIINISWNDVDRMEIR